MCSSHAPTHGADSEWANPLDYRADRGGAMAVMLPIIPEDSWVRISEFRGRRWHKVFATNGDVLTHCNRWLKRDRVEVYARPGRSWVACRLCVEAEARG